MNETVKPSGERLSSVQELEKREPGKDLDLEVAKMVMGKEVSAGLVLDHVLEDADGNSRKQWLDPTPYSTVVETAFNTVVPRLVSQGAVLQLSVAPETKDKDGVVIPGETAAVFTTLGKPLRLGVSGKYVAHAVCLAALDYVRNEL